MEKRKKGWELYRKDILPICVISVVFGGLCLYKIINGGEYSGDEFFSLEDTLGYAYTGKKLEWDFHTASVTDQAVKINPYFYVLAWWIRLAGTDALLLRGLSVIIGLAAVISFYYVVRKLTGSMEWACMAGLLLSVNEELVIVSTIIRGYALLLLLMIWIFYFCYRSLNAVNQKEPRSKAGRWLHTWLDFDYRYAAAAVILLYIAYRIRPFAVLYMIGIGVYILIRAVWARERKFIVTGGVFWGVVAFFVIASAFHLEKYFTALGIITGRLQKYGSIGIHNLAYWQEAGYIFRLLPVTVLGFGLALYHLCRGNEGLQEEWRDILLYMLAVSLTIVAAFTMFVNWPHNSRYILAVYPPAIVVVSGGYYIAVRRGEWTDRKLMYAVLLACAVTNVSSMFAAGKGAEYFCEAYRSVAEYAEGEPIFITGINLRGYYAKDIIPEYEWQPMTNKGDVPDIDHLAELSEIGREHSEGVITCEDSRWYHFRNSFWLLLNEDAFEKITGSGVDDTNVENWVYQLAYPAEGSISEESGKVTLFGYNFGGMSRIAEEADKTVLELQLNGSVSELTMLCVKVNQYYAGGGRRQRYIQLILEPNGQAVQYYRVELENDEAPMKSTLDDCYTIYNNGKDPESFDDCYTIL